jgi:hypothetical protein
VRRAVRLTIGRLRILERRPEALVVNVVLVEIERELLEPAELAMTSRSPSSTPTTDNPCGDFTDATHATAA